MKKLILSIILCLSLLASVFAEGNKYARRLKVGDSKVEVTSFLEKVDETENAIGANALKNDVKTYNVSLLAPQVAFDHGDLLLYVDLSLIHI